MNDIIMKIKIVIGSIISILAFFLGDFWFLFAGFLALNITDVFFGIKKARFTKSENSVKGAKGIIKKLGYWATIAMSFFISVCLVEIGERIEINLDFMVLLGWYVLVNFIINEIRSITENLVILGVAVPEIFIKGLSVIETAVNRDGDKVGKD